MNFKISSSSAWILVHLTKYLSFQFVHVRYAPVAVEKSVLEEERKELRVCSTLLVWLRDRSGF